MASNLNGMRITMQRRPGCLVYANRSDSSNLPGGARFHDWMDGRLVPLPVLSDANSKGQDGGTLGLAIHNRNRVQYD